VTGRSDATSTADPVALERLETRALLSTIAGAGQPVVVALAQQPVRAAATARSAVQSAKSASNAASQQTGQQSGQNTDGENQIESADQSDEQSGNAVDQGDQGTGGATTGTAPANQPIFVQYAAASAPTTAIFSERLVGMFAEPTESDRAVEHTVAITPQLMRASSENIVTSLFGRARIVFSIASPQVPFSGAAVAYKLETALPVVMTKLATFVESSAPAIVNQFVEAIRSLALAQKLPQQAVYHFLSVNAAATFQDAITQFINECAALPAALLQSAAPSRARAWSVTVTVLAADTILFAYLLHRARRKKLAEQPAGCDPSLFSTRRVSAD